MRKIQQRLSILALAFVASALFAACGEKAPSSSPGTNNANGGDKATAKAEAKPLPILTYFTMPG